MFCFFRFCVVCTFLFMTNDCLGSERLIPTKCAVPIDEQASNSLELSFVK